MHMQHVRQQQQQDYTSWYTEEPSVCCLYVSQTTTASHGMRKREGGRGDVFQSIKLWKTLSAEQQAAVVYYIISQRNVQLSSTSPNRFPEQLPKIVTIHTIQKGSKNHETIKFNNIWSSLRTLQNDHNSIMMDRSFVSTIFFLHP